MFKFAVVVLGLILSATPSFSQSNERSTSLDHPESAGRTVETGGPGSLNLDDVLTLEGVRAKISLVTEVSSKLVDGTPFQARLDEAVVKNGQTLLPEGTILAGKLKTTHARRMMRAGSVFMQFDRLMLPGGARSGVELSLLSAESNAVKTGSEGELRPALSKKRLIIQLGGTALTAKLADDLAEEAGGTAISAGTARYIGAAAAATFFLLQKGREVKLHRGDKLLVEFGRQS